MKTYLIVFILGFNLSIGNLLSQEVELYEPINYRNAVKEGTRSRDGKPGSNYWQNHADYNIEVKLDTTEKIINGYETISYYNQSMDTIKNLVLRLYPNLFKKGAVRNMKIHPENINNGMVLDTLIINNNGVAIDKDTWTNGTNLYIREIDPLAPYDTIKLVCRWNYKLPYTEDFNRTGYYKDKAWFIGYFYPQIAVYDDLEYFFHIEGWDLELNHQGLQEFYNDFNNYKVEIEVPEGFYVWATGTLMNEQEIFTKDFLRKLKGVHNSDDNVQLLAGDSLNKNYLLKNIWKYEAKGVTDFGFGTAPDYIWEASSVKLGNKRVFVDVAYHPESKTFPLVLDISKATIKYASMVYPAIEFPYSHATIFNGMHGGGMEFPMIANNSEADTSLTYLLTFHEIFHNYTPFMVGLNEKRYPFMDEGLTQYFTDHYLQNKHGNMSGLGNIFDNYNEYTLYGDNPIINSSYLLNEFNVYYYYYFKVNLAYKLFAEMVGEENFKKAFQEFVKRWKGKHPTPYDFFYTMNEVLEENYNWFWKAWFFDFGYADLALEQKGKELIVKRIGVGALPVPVNLIVENVDGSTSTISESMEVWKNGRSEISIKLSNIKKIKSIRVDVSSVPDIDESNNLLLLK